MTKKSQPHDQKSFKPDDHVQHITIAIFETKNKMIYN